MNLWNIGFSKYHMQKNYKILKIAALFKRVWNGEKVKDKVYSIAGHFTQLQLSVPKEYWVQHDLSLNIV